jgi:hypothetical protein
MSYSRIPFVKKVALVAAAFSLLSCDVLAGEHVRAGSQPYRPEAAPAPVFRAVPYSTSVSVVVTPAQPKMESVVIGLRGPDGELRRFPLEGGRAAVQAPIVLRPGQSVTIRWVAAR